MAQLAEANDVLYLHFLQPNQYVPSSKPMSEAERRAAIAPGAHANPILIDGYALFRGCSPELADAGVSFYDLTMIYSGEEEPVYVDTCCHVNDLGNEILAEAIARRVGEQLAARPAGG